MKLLHLSDLHIGKKLNDFSLIDDQKYILDEILKIADSEKPDGVIIAGDIYDKSVPGGDAVTLFDYFISELYGRNLNVFAISGNHDSTERIAYASKIMDKAGIHLSRIYNGNIDPIVLEDKYGKVNFYLLQFIKPAYVREFFTDEINSYTDALRAVISKMQVNKKERNIIITHQFVTGASVSGSEDFSVGGTDNVDASVFDAFDYVALGHIHRPQNVGSEKIRYCGTPLKYSFSEAKDEKSVTIIELNEKSSLNIRTIPLKPMRDLIELKGNYNEITSKAFYLGKGYQNSFVHITLTDEEDIFDAIGKLRTIYPYIMKLDYDNTRTRTNNEITGASNTEIKSPYQLFNEFYELQNGSPMSEPQKKFIDNAIEEIWEGEK